METTDAKDSSMKRTMTYLMIGLFGIFFSIIILANSIS